MKPSRNEFEDFVARLLEAVEEGAVILVEGKRDRQSLEDLGVPAWAIVEINQGNNLAEASASVDARKIILLTDLDRTGARLKRELHALLASEGKRVDTSFRKGLLKLGVRHVEHLSKRMKAEP